MTGTLRFQTLRAIVDSYFLEREIRKSTIKQHRNIIRAFLNWCGCDDLPAAEFTAARINKFLVEKQDAGKSSYYRRSLRSVLKAMYRHLYDGNPPERIRPVKAGELEPESWSPEEMERLIAACDLIPLTRKMYWYWRSLIRAAYYTGLNLIDLERVRLSDVTANGTLPFHRSKTGKRVVVSLPADVLEEVKKFHSGEDGPIWRRPKTRSDNAQGKQFSNIVKAAGLTGSFKKLRKTCGTQIELHNPGRGHEHLGHDRKIFEQHYGDRKKLAKPPAMPPRLGMMGGGGGDEPPAAGMLSIRPPDGPGPKPANRAAGVEGFDWL